MSRSQETPQFVFGSVEEAVDQFADGGAAGGFAGSLGDIEERAAGFMAGKLAFPDQPFENGHDGGIG